MCGIAGLCSCEGSPLPSDARLDVQTMIDYLAHRGPDGEGLWQEESVCLGHRRLSIIDFTGGAQPMHSADRRLSIVFNGEIYNFQQLKQELAQKGSPFTSRSDTEVILEAYRQWGTDCLKHFEGMFAFALWDKQNRLLFLARDRFGKKPLFYTIQNGRFYFASEMTALTLLKHLSFTLSPQSVMRYLAYEYVPTPETIYQEVSILPPAHFMLVKPSGISLQRYWDLPVPDEKESRSEQELCAELRILIQQAVRRRMISDVPLGVFLSGGIDSSIVTGLMAQQSSEAVKTFSIGFNEASYNETGYARLIAKVFATDHYEEILSADECADHLPEIVSNMDVPLADASVSPSWILARLTRKNVTVALGGDGADELWAGYEHYGAFNLAQRYNRWPLFFRRYLLEPVLRYLPTSAGYVNPRLVVQTFLRGSRSPDWLRVQTLLTSIDPAMQSSLFQPEWLAEYRAYLQPEHLFASTQKCFKHWQPENVASPLARVFYTYLRQFLLDDILVKVDRCSMLHSLEVRAPFLDKDLAEFTAKLPLRYKLRGFKGKQLLKKAVSDLLPAQILHRNKRGFQIPVAAWLRGRIKPLMEDLLNETFLRKQGIFHPGAVRKLMDEHLANQADWRKPLWTLLVLQLWLKTHA